MAVVTYTKLMLRLPAQQQLLFYSRLCPSTAGSSPPPVLQLSLSLAILVHTAPCCPTMSSLQRRSDLPTDLTPFICHSAFLMVHLLSFIRAMCPAHVHFVLVTYWTMSVALVLCLMMVLRILSFSLTLSIFLSMARWLVTSFFPNTFATDHVWHPDVITVKTHCLKTFLYRFMGGCLSRQISLYFPKPLHPAFILIETTCFVLFSIAVVCPRHV